MSRIGKTLITIQSDVSFEQTGNTIVVKGPKGTLSYVLPKNITVNKENNTITVINEKNTKDAHAVHGYVRAHLSNLIYGVHEGFTKTLELSGVGYRAALTGTNLILTVGFSHPVTIVPPEGITFTTTEGKIMVTGADKQLVGQIASNIRAVKKPEPYKGKGIKYQGEHVRKKAGKSAKTVGGATGAAK